MAKATTTAARGKTGAPLEEDPAAPRAAAFNASHWRAVDAAAETLETEGLPLILAAAPGHGAAAVIAAAVKTAQRASADEEADNAVDEPADEAVEPPKTLLPIYAAPRTFDFAVFAGALLEALQLPPSVAADAPSVIAAALRRRAADGTRRVLILRAPESDAPCARSIALLEGLGAASSDAPGLSLVLHCGLDTARAIAAAAEGPLAAPEATATLRPHGPDEVRAYLRAEAPPAQDQEALRRASASAYEATAGAPELLARLARAASMEGGAGAPLDADGVRRAAEAAGVAEETALLAAARDAARRLAPPEPDPVEPSTAPAPTIAEPPSAEVETSTAPTTTSPPISAAKASGAGDLSAAARGGLRRRSRRRVAVVALAYAGAVSAAGLVIVSGVALNGRETVLDMAEATLSVAGAVGDAVAEQDLGLVSDALGDLAAEAETTQSELERARTRAALDSAEPERAEAVRERRISAALALAAERFELGRYTRPSGGSAYDALLEADRAAPRDPRVLAAFDALTAHYAAEAERSLRRADYDGFYEAQEVIERIRSRRPI